MDPVWHELMVAVQLAGLYQDCKHFVDMPVATSWDQIAKDWQALKAACAMGTPSREELQLLVRQHFGEPGRSACRIAWVLVRNYM